MIEVLSTARLRAHVRGCHRGDGVARGQVNVGVPSKEEVAGDDREEGGNVLLLEIGKASPEKGMAEEEHQIWVLLDTVVFLAARNISYLFSSCQYPTTCRST